MTKKIFAVVVCILLLISGLSVFTVFTSDGKNPTNFEVASAPPVLHTTITRVNTTPERLQTLPVKHSIKITAQAYDENSNPILFGVNYTWSLDNTSVGTLNPVSGDETVFTAIQPGRVNVIVNATYNLKSVSNWVPIEVPHSLEYYARLSSSPINIIYKPITQPEKNSRLQIDIEITAANYYIENNMTVIRAKARLWDGTDFPQPHVGEYLQFPCHNPSGEYYTKYMYGYLSNSIYFPAGTLVTWWVYATLFDRDKFSTIQINSTIYEYEVQGAWRNTGRDYDIHTSAAFLANVNVTFSPVEPRSYDRVTVTIKSLYDIPMSTTIYIWVKPNPITKGDEWYPAPPGKAPWMGGEEYGVCKPMYSPLQQFVIPGYAAGTEVVFTIRTRDETAAPYYHYLPASSPEVCYDIISWRYKVSYGRLFNGTSFNHNIIIESYPYVLNETPPYQTLPQHKKVLVKIYSNDTNVPIAAAGCFYEVTQGGFVFAGQGEFERNSSTEMYFELPGQAYSSKVSFHVKAWDRERTELVSPVYTYLIEPPPPPTTAEYMYFEGRVMDEKLRRGATYFFVSDANVTIENTTLKYKINMRTDSIGRFYTKDPETNQPKFFKKDTRFTFTIKYVPKYELRTMAVTFNATLKTNQYDKKLFDEGGFVYAKVIVDNLTIYVYFNPPEKELPTVYAQPEPFADWYHYVTVFAAVIATIPIVLYLTRLRRRKEEEQKRITL